jgi:hypothetical protein
VTAQASPAAVDPAGAFVERYEQVRCEALRVPDAKRGGGLVLFMARGMVAWMQAWSSCAAPPRIAESTAARPVSSSGLNAEVASILTTMTIAAVAEVSA